MVIFSIALVLYKENFYEDVELGTTVLPSEFQTLVNAPLKKNHLIIVLEWPWVCVLGGGQTVDLHSQSNRQVFI